MMHFAFSPIFPRPQNTNSPIFAACLHSSLVPQNVHFFLIYVFYASPILSDHDSFMHHALRVLEYLDDPETVNERSMISLISLCPMAVYTDREFFTDCYPIHRSMHACVVSVVRCSPDCCSVFPIDDRPI